MGIETMGGIYDVVIESNSTIPTKKSKIYSTASDNQPSVEIHILQGERKMARDNRPVGRFILDGIPPAPRGMPQVEVTFDIDANGILSVSAKDKGTGKQQSIRVEASTGLSKEEIARMKAEADANAETDRIARDQAEKINAADALIFQTEKQLKEYGDKIPGDKRSAIESALAQLKSAYESRDVNLIDPALESLNTAWQAASQDIYQAQQASGEKEAGQDFGETSGSTNGKGQEGDVTDVEFEEMDNNKK
jgi:molecular chaperone DnaK